MATIFDGKSFADRIGSELAAQIKTKNLRLKLVTIVNPNNAAGMMYSQLKKQLADKLGVVFDIHQVDTSAAAKKIITEANSDLAVNGIMLQLPFPDSGQLIQLINLHKDVDGLKIESPFLPAVVRAVVAIIEAAGGQNKSKIVVGNQGFVGAHLQKTLRCEGMDKSDMNVSKLKQSDIVISCTGLTGLIKPSMVKQGVIAIDVGYPQGDFDPQIANTAAFFTPVPGGVGPVTVVMLFCNLVDILVLAKGIK